MGSCCTTSHQEPSKTIEKRTPHENLLKDEDDSQHIELEDVVSQDYNKSRKNERNELSLIISGLFRELLPEKLLQKVLHTLIMDFYRLKYVFLKKILSILHKFSRWRLCIYCKI